MISTFAHVLIELFMIAVIITLLRYLWSQGCSIVQRTIELWREIRDDDYR